MYKIAAVTGSRRGIGYGIVKELISNNYHVIMSGVTAKEETKEIIEGLRVQGAFVDYVPCNIGKKEDRDMFIEYIKKNYGRLDVHVNNAGTAPKERVDILETTEESFDYVMDVNAKGTFFMCQQAANLMIEFQKSDLENYKPRIINISSISAFTSSVDRAEYCIAKAGISMITKLFAARLSEYNIPVFEVSPGIIRTDMTRAVTQKYEKMIEEGITPIKRMGEPEDVAKCVMAAVSGQLDFATGQVLHADGGFHIRRL